MTPRVLCLGDVMVDVVAQLSGPLETGSDRPARTVLRGGGSAANTATWLEHVGTDAAVVGRVGSDPLGAWSREQLGAALTRGVSTDLSSATGTCVVLVSPDGERTMIPDAGANAELRPEHLDADLFRPGDHLHVSGYALFGRAREAARHALATARSAGMTLSVGAASAAPLRDLGAEQFFDLIGTDLLLFANHDEARTLTGLDDPGAAAEVLRARVGNCVVTSGSGRAFWCSPEATASADATSIEVVDSTGAGDAFAAAVLAATVTGIDAHTALRRGHDLAALACGAVGGRAPREPQP